MERLLIVKLGSTYSWLSERIGDFDDWIVERTMGFKGEIDVVSPPSGEPLPPPEDVSGVLLTGSHSMVTARETWSEKTNAWIKGALERNTPILGICYGHQLLASAAGGVVGYNPRGREFGLAEVNLLPAAKDDPLFHRLPSRLPVHVCHAQSVLRPPEGSVILAANAHDPFHAFRIGSNAWGVQFHPEFPAAATRSYVEHHANDLRAEGKDPEILLRSIRETPESASILTSFAELVSA